MSTDALIFKRGEDPTFSLDFKDEDEETPLDITGFTIYAEVIRGQSAIMPALTVDNGGVEIVDAAAGQASIIFTEEQTLLIPLGKIAYLKVFLISQADETLIFGPIYLQMTL
jgi:hypothetical protein